MRDELKKQINSIYGQYIVSSNPSNDVINSIYREFINFRRKENLIKKLNTLLDYPLP